MQNYKIFPYDWKIDSKQLNVTSIRIYGLDEQDKTVCVRTDNFTPFVYIELPGEIDWDENTASRVVSKIDNMMADKKPLFKSLEYRKRLYYAHIDKNGERKKFPYLFLAFSTKSDIRMLSYKIKTALNIPGVGRVKLKMHEQDANEILQLVCRKNLPTAGWIKFRGVKVDVDEMITSCDYEFMVDWKYMESYESDKVPRPKILSFDLEVYSTDPNTMPKTERLGDKIFQISCVIGKQGDSEDKYAKTLLTFGEPDSEIVGDDTDIRTFETEDDLLMGFTQFIQETNPNIIVGYNIFGFDIPYMIARATAPCMNLKDFAKLGFLKDTEANMKTIKWSSSAYGKQEFEFLDAEGRLFVDLLPLVKRDYKMDTYSLKAISTFFMGETKDPLSPKGIFKCYDIGIKRNENGTFGKKARKAMAIVGKYCVQDSALVLKLFEKLQTWIGLTEMAKVCNVSIFTLYTQGQQIKVYSQVYKRCMYEGYVVEKDGYVVQENEHYTGAHVFDPIPGAYEDVIPFDFTSLYPTTIIAYNICWSTLVTDDNIPDSMCNVIEWHDHVGCIHDNTVRKTRPKYIMCAKRKYRFLKSPMGILPEMLTDLLSTRKKTKKQMKDKQVELKEVSDNSKATELNTLITVLNKRQLAFKVSANSAYGAMGVQKGYLPFMPGAMATTAKGRESVRIVSEYIPKQHGGQLIYGDTDSCYIHFPHMIGKSAKELWKYSEMVADDTSKLFPSPMRLEFEEVIYRKFFIITKKRYMSLACGKDGIVSNKIEKKGVILARRDNAKIVRDIYAENMMKVFHKIPEEDILYDLIQTLNKMFSKGFPYTDFIITKSIKGCNELKLENVQDEPCLDRAGNQKIDNNGELMWRRTGRIGDYKIDLWRTQEEKEKKFKLKKVTTAKDYYLKCLPAQAQLAEKMRRRGKPVSDGTRLEYVMLTDGTVKNVKDKKYDKIESADYYKDHSHILKIDYLCYLNNLASALDQVLNVVHKKQDFVLEQYNIRYQKLKVLEELTSLSKPKIELIGSNIIIVE